MEFIWKSSVSKPGRRSEPNVYRKGTNVNPHGLKRGTGSTVIQNTVPYEGSLHDLMTRWRAN